MDYSSLVIAAAIALYGVFEYRRREKKHRFHMEFLRRNIEPPQAEEEFVSRLRMVSISLTAFIAAAAAGILIVKGIADPRYGTPLIVIGCIFLSLAVPLVYIIFRDRRAPRGRLRRTE